MPKSEIAASYLSLGTVYNKLQDSENALSSFKKSLNVLYQPGKYGLLSGERFNNIARVFKSRSEIDSALYYLNIAEAVFDTINVKGRYRRQKNETYNVFAQIYLETGELEKVKYYLDLSKDFGLSPLDEVLWYERYSEYNRQRKDYKEAELMLLEGIRIAEEEDARNKPPLKARRNIELARIYSLQNQHDKALDVLQKGIRILAPSADFDTVSGQPQASEFLGKQYALIILQEKARILKDKFESSRNPDYLKASFQTNLAACEVVKLVRQGIFSDVSKNELAERSIAIFEESIAASYALYELLDDPQYISTAFKLAESNKAQLLLENLNEQEARGFSGLPDSLSKKEEEIRYYLAALEDEAIRMGSENSTNDRIFEVREELNQLTSFLEKTYPRYYEQKYKNDPIEPADLQDRLLDKSTALIEYFVGENAIYVFVLTREQIIMDKLDLKELELGDIAQFRNLLITAPGNGDPETEYNEFVRKSRNVYDSYVRKAIDRLPESITSLIVVPDDQINYIPFEVLLVEDVNDKKGYGTESQSYLFETYAIHYNYSATLLDKVLGKNQSTFTDDFIGYAPSFGDMASVERSYTGDFLLANLKCSEDEVSNITALIGGVGRMDDDATKENFLGEVNNYKIVHLATHAFVNLSDSKLNRIFLQEDYLSDVNLYNLQLNTELAVLSACNTGTGELLKGEGVMNLARGFINAGCSSTLMSMWSVDDCTTADLMLLFYKELKKGKTKDEALRNAKIKYLKSAGKSKMHPYYWAAFVPFGDMKAMDIGGNWFTKNKIPIILFVGAALLFVVVRRIKK